MGTLNTSPKICFFMETGSGYISQASLELMTLLLPGTTKPGPTTPYTLAPIEQLPIPFLCDTEGVTALALLAWPVLLGSLAGARHPEAPPPLLLSFRPTPPLTHGEGLCSGEGCSLLPRPSVRECPVLPCFAVVNVGVSRPLVFNSFGDQKRSVLGECPV